MDPGVQFNYQSIGSGGGINNLTRQTVDFGASDAPMTDAAMAAAPGKILHLPIVAGGVAIIYNLPGDPKLKLDGDTLADIYLGNITKWNDPKIAALNPGVSLPDVRDCARASGRRQRHEFHLHRLFEQRESGVGGLGRQRHVGEMAGGRRDGRQGQRRRVPARSSRFPAASATRNLPTPTRTKFPMPT